MNKYTQGPWAADGGKIRGAMMTAKPYNIASVNSHATTEGIANARLIAAAPELLEALWEMVARHSTPGGHSVGCIELPHAYHGHCCALSQARAAIARATAE